VEKIDTIKYNYQIKVLMKNIYQLVVFHIHSIIIKKTVLDL